MESWLPLVGHPDYEASDKGRIRRTDSQRVLSITRTAARPYVGLMRNNIRIQRGLALLVLRSFVPSPRPDFTTPIHYNGDVNDCRVANMDWRPRWFAIKHTRQFKFEFPDTAPVKNMTTNMLYDNARDVVEQHGILLSDLFQSISNKTYVFPLMQVFEWLE